jgi:broad specificity phosphatase PhoE
MRSLLLIRHGETALNLSGHYVSSSDPVLSQRGHEQASMLAKSLAAYPLTSIITSPLTRCVQTANAILTAQQHDVPLRKDERLHELGLGELEGLGLQEIAQRGLTEVFRSWRQGLPPGYPDGAETFEAAAERIAPVFDELLPVEGVIAVVGHSHALRILLCARVLRVPAEAHRRLSMDHARIAEVGWERETPRLASLNALALGVNEPRVAPF